MAQIPMGPQLYVGRGLNPDSGKVYAVAIDHDPAESVGTGQNVLFLLHEVTSSQQMAEVMNISASASYGAGWGVSAEVSLSQSKSINSYYTYALIQCVVTNPAEVIRNPRFKQDAQNLLMQGWDQFAAQYGWEYLEGMITGGSYYALIEVQTTSTAQQDDVKVKLSGYYGPFSASAQFENDLKQIASTTTINVNQVSSAGSGQAVQADLDGMLNAARNFPATAKADPVPVFALTADYRDTVPLPANVADPNSLSRINQRNTLSDLAKAYQDLRDYRADVEFVLDHLLDFDDYKDLDPASITTKRQDFSTSLAQTAGEIDAVVKSAAACATDYQQCKAYVPGLQKLTLPRIGGELMTIKDIEDKLAALEQHVKSDPATGVLTLDAPWVHATGNIQILSGGQITGTGRLHVSGSELLYLLNHDGVIVGKEWGGSGNLTAEGNLSVAGEAVLAQISVQGNVISVPGRLETRGGDMFVVSNTNGMLVGNDLAVAGRIGVNGQSPNPRTEGWGGGIHTWDIEVEGTGWSRHGWQTGNRDLAEHYRSRDYLEPGDVVRLGGDADLIERTHLPWDQALCGVISSCPGVLLGADSERSADLNEFPVVLVGRAPCKVTNENGPIASGDLLTSSSTLGHAMRAVVESGRPRPASGSVLGKALDSCCSEVAVIDVFLALS